MIRRALLAATTVFAALDARAQEPLPSAAAIHARYLEALGGRTAIAAQTNVRLLGRIEVPAQGISGTIEIATATPPRIFSRIVIPGMGEILSGFDGTTAWSINPAMGPMVLSGRAREQMEQQADLHLPLHLDRWVDSMKVLGAVEFSGKPTYEVQVWLRTGENFREYYDRETGLLVGVSRTQASPMGDLPATSVLDDYRDVGGVRMAGTIRLTVMGIEQVIRVDSVSLAPIPDSVFALPAAIAALRRP
jgi:hypothetical protein